MKKKKKNVKPDDNDKDALEEDEEENRIWNRKRDKQSTEIRRKQRRTFLPNEQVLVYVRKQQKSERNR
jgi:hypothetical protein